MDLIKIVKSPTCIKGRTLKFGSLYGKINGIIYNVDHFDREEIARGCLTFWIYQERETVTTKKHGTYTKGGYWYKCQSLTKGKYADIVKTCIHYIMRNKLLNGSQPTPYVRNTEIRANGAPKRKEAQNEMVFRVANVGYAISPHISTEYDACRKIRPGVIYNQYS